MIAPRLDPADWADFRRYAHRMLDHAIGHVETVRERPVWQPLPARVKQAIAEPLPLAPQGYAAVGRDFEDNVLPYATGNTHPRFLGWVHGSGTAGGIVAEMLAAAMNANVGGREHSAVYVERQVIDWSRQIFGLPEGAGGLLVSGTSMATVIGLTIARNRALGSGARRMGLQGGGPKLVAYASQEAHSSIAKAMELIGLGSDALRSIEVDEEFALKPEALAKVIAADRAAGLKPFAIIATAGSVNTGTIDPIDRIAEIAAGEKLWLHIDGAFGALAILSPNEKHRLAGIERADSIAFDFHKWLHVPYDAGCILVRDAAEQLAAFSTRPAYLAGNARGLAAGDPWYCELGPDLSRGFRALKVWFTLKEHGLEKLGNSIAGNCALARGLSERVAKTPPLELLAPTTLNIVCFRYAPPGLAAAELDRLNGEIVVALHERGIAAPSTTRIGGKLAIRCNITNHRTSEADLALLADSVISIGGEFHGKA